LISQQKSKRKNKIITALSKSVLLNANTDRDKTPKEKKSPKKSKKSNKHNQSVVMGDDLIPLTPVNAADNLHSKDQVPDDKS